MYSVMIIYQRCKLKPASLLKFLSIINPGKKNFHLWIYFFKKIYKIARIFKY